MHACMTVERVIEELNLEPPLEGGYDKLISAYGGGGVALAYLGCSRILPSLCTGAAGTVSVGKRHIDLADHFWIGLYG